MALERVWEFLPSVRSFCLLRNQVGILNWAGFCMMVTIRSSSSELSSPALISVRVVTGRQAGKGDKGTSHAPSLMVPRNPHTVLIFACAVPRSLARTNPVLGNASTYRLLRSTSAFLQTKLEYRRPIPLISVKANMIFPPPLTLVLRRRRMCCCAKVIYSRSRGGEIDQLMSFAIHRSLHAHCCPLIPRSPP